MIKTKKITVAASVLLIFSILGANLAIANETDDNGFSSTEEYDYYREQIPDYVISFNKEFAEWYVDNSITDSPEQDDQNYDDDVNCNCEEDLEEYYDYQSQYDESVQEQETYTKEEKDPLPPTKDNNATIQYYANLIFKIMKSILWI